jgi:hypothetical protein
VQRRRLDPPLAPGEGQTRQPEPVAAELQAEQPGVSEQRQQQRKGHGPPFAALAALAASQALTALMALKTFMPLMPLDARTPIRRGPAGGARRGCARRHG